MSPFDRDAFKAWLAKAEADREHRRRLASRLEGHADQDFTEVDLALLEFERGMRRVRRAIKALPGLLSEADCGTEPDQLRRDLNRLSAAWREVKVAWQKNDPRPPAAR